MGRSSFAKRDREQTKRAKAEAKRQRRQAGPNSEGDELDVADAADEDQTPTEELLQRIEEIHRLHDERRISDDEFETTKADLLGRLRVD